ncbi:MAG: efflux RND transporter periplasmic adaptor subunit [Caldilineaceae bacterium]
MKRFLQTLGFLIILGALAGGGYWYYFQRSQTTTATASTSNLTQLVEVRQGDLSASLTVVGQLDAVQNSTLHFDKLGTATNLLTLDIVAGNTVTKGQVLATIDPAPYEQTLEQAKTTLQEAQNTLDDLQTPPTELELAKAEADVSKTELDLRQALKKLVDLQEPTDLTDLQNAVKNAQDDLALVKLRQELSSHDSVNKSVRDTQYAVDWNQRRYWELKDLIASGKANLEQTQELDTVQETLDGLQVDLIRVQSQQSVSQQSAETSVSNAQLALTEAQQNLTDAQKGSTELDVADAKVAIQAATVAAQKAWQARDDLKAGPDETDLASAQSAVIKAQQAVSDAETALAATKLLAPFDGTILETNAIPGTRITSGSNILALADLKHLQVEVPVDETTIRQVKVDQPVRITFDAFPGQRFDGKVLSVPMQGTLQGDVMVYEVTTSLEGAEKLPLLVGMTANVDIAVGQVQNALLVPKMAVLSVKGGSQVLVPNPSDPTGQPQAVPVETGLSNGIFTEIKSGLKAGDSVIVQVSTSDSNQFGFPGGGGLFGGPGGPLPGAGGNNGNNRSGSSGGTTRRSGGG